jgi:hypothetical protein
LANASKLACSGLSPQSLIFSENKFLLNFERIIGFSSLSSFFIFSSIFLLPKGFWPKEPSQKAFSKGGAYLGSF